LPFKSSEQAVVISEDVDSEEIAAQQVEPGYSNEFITEDMMAFMPKKEILK